MLSKFKEQIAAQMSPNQKDIVKSMLRRVRLYQPRPEQVYFEAVFRGSPAVSFIQIGANDGVDFVRTVVREFQGTHAINGVLVEPQKYFHEQLLVNYDGIRGVQILNVAVSDSEKSMTLYYLDYSSKQLPEWAKGLGSLSKDVLLSHRHLIPDLDSYIREMQVPCISVPELLKSLGPRPLDVLVTDTEGHDLIILRQFDFATLKPKLIVYESKHLSKADFESCEKMLTGFGYKVTHLQNDNSVAVRGDL